MQTGSRNLFDARHKITVWRDDYNVARPHSSLAYRTPGGVCSSVATPFVLIPFRTAAGTARQGYPDGALRGLDGRTRLQRTT